MLKTSLKKQSILITIAFVLYFSFNIFAQSPTDRARNFVNEGNALFDKADYQGAMEKYLKALEADKEYSWTYWSVGRTFAKLHEHKTAAESYTRFLEKESDVAKIYVVFQIGDQYRLAKEFELSSKIFDVALNSTPKQALDYAALADIYSYRGNLTLAVENEIKAINFRNDDDADDASRYIGLSWYYSFLQQHQNAINAATKAIQLDSQEAMAYTNRCRAYNDLKQYDYAITDCQKALSLRPNHGETIYYLANSYRAKKNIKEATRLNKLAIPNLVDELKEAAKSEQITLHDYCYLLGNALFEDGQYSEAIAAYEAGLEFRGNFPVLRFNLGMAYLKVRNKSAALDQYSELLKINTTIAMSLKKRIDSTK